MPPVALHVHAERAMRVLSLLRAEPRFHAIADIAQQLAITEKEVRELLESVRLAGAAGWTLDLEFGDEVEPAEPLGADCVRLPLQQLDAMPLPMSALELLRTAIAAHLAATQVPGTEQARLLESVKRKVLTSLGLDEDLDLEAEVPAKVLAFQEAREQGRAVTFEYRKLSDNAPETRLVTPITVTRSSKAWLLEGYDHARQERRQFREDRVIGGIVDAGEAVEHGLEADPVEAPVEQVRLRFPSDRIWALESFRQQDEKRQGRFMEVTIGVYPPVDHRLVRLLPLLGPEATLVWPDPVLAEAYRDRLRQVLARTAS